jgi:hypothetical protein
VREEFERRLTASARRFQAAEATHLKQMREFAESYCQITDDSNNQWGRVRAGLEFKLMFSARKK